MSTDTQQRRARLRSSIDQWNPRTLDEWLNHCAEEFGPPPGTDITADAVLGLCKEKLARFKVSKHVLFMDAGELPTTPVGKVQKFRLGDQEKTRPTTDRGTTKGLVEA